MTKAIDKLTVFVGFYGKIDNYVYIIYLAKFENNFLQY